MIRWIALLILLLAAPAAAEDARKVALIVANGKYANAGVLENPVNDARIVAESAKRAGFDSVTLASDLSLADFQRALRDFRNRAAGAQVAMVYYAGHGIEGSGKNWLIPVDAALASDLDLAYEAIDLDRVMEAISGARVRMVVLDACRNNPFGRSWRAGKRAVTRGLGGVEVDDVLVIYAAAPGQTASDGSGGNSPFARSLAKRLQQPGLPIQLLGGAVRDDVLESTGGEQRPFVSASITGTPVYLVPGASGPAAATASAPPPAPAPTIDNATLDALAWQGALGANSRESFEEYRRQFPRGRFALLAEQNIARMVRPTAPQVTRTPPPQVQQPAIAAATVGEGAPALIFPESSTRVIPRALVEQLSLAQLRLARHGFIFSSPELAVYFKRFSWYRPVGRDVTLNQIEQQNVRNFQSIEKTRGD